MHVCSIDNVQACELFILDLTIRGWVHAEDNRRRTLQRSDIAASIAHWEVLDFLVRSCWHASFRQAACRQAAEHRDVV